MPAKKSKTYIFQSIAKEGIKAGVKFGTEEARDWYRDRAMSVTRVNVNKLVQEAPTLYTRLAMQDIGRMYCYFYDPKTKADLPYYDKFPLIFVIGFQKGSFLGMNLHYLPPIYRARLMDALYSIEMIDNARKSQKLKLTYDLLNSAAKFKYFQPCIKKYLISHVKSRFLYIPYDEWDTAMMLPTERFMKAKKNQVWKESQQLIRKRK